jgi:hypothetical protein
MLSLYAVFMPVLIAFDMDFHRATTTVLKAGRSKTPFLLFFGNRKRGENEPGSLLPTAILLVLVATVLGICIYAFLTGRLG